MKICKYKKKKLSAPLKITLIEILNIYYKNSSFNAKLVVVTIINLDKG